MTRSAVPFYRQRNKRIFVIGPIGEPNSPIRRRSDNVLEYLISPIGKELGFGVDRADRLAMPGEITEQIIERLIEDDIVVADLHGHNANVFYELGVRDTTGKPTILLAKTEEENPFDLQNRRTIFFNESDIGSWEKAKEELKRHLEFVSRSPEILDSAVTMAFELLRSRRSAGLLSAFDLMEPVRATRRLIRDAMKAGKTWRDLSKEDCLQVDELCRRFDLLGLYDRIGVVDRLHIDMIYAVPFVDLYERFLGDYVEWLRSGEGGRDRKHFWELVQFYERVKDVPKWHPVETGEEDWPEDPRKPKM